MKAKDLRFAVSGGVFRADLDDDHRITVRTTLRSESWTGFLQEWDKPDKMWRVACNSSATCSRLEYLITALLEEHNRIHTEQVEDDGGEEEETP